MTFKILLIFFIATVCSCKHLSSDLSEIKENPEAHAKRLYAALQYAIISKNKKSFFYQDNENYGFTLVSDDPLGAKFLADISTIEDYAYSDERSKELAKFLFPMLNSEEKEVLFNLVHRGQISSISFGEKFAFYDVIGRYMDWFPSEFIASLISPEKFQNYLRTIQIKPGEVQWDGNTSRIPTFNTKSSLFQRSYIILPFFFIMSLEVSIRSKNHFGRHLIIR